MPTYGSPIQMNGNAINGLPSATNNDQPATYGQLLSAVEGIDWKDSVVAASTGNVNIASAPSTLDGVTLSNGDRLLLKDQTDPAANGIRVFTSAGAALARSTDASTAAEISGIAVNVLSGGTANGGTTWLQPSKITTLDTDPITFSSFGGVPDATESVKGKLEIATQAETNTGTDDTRAVTPAKLSNSTWVSKRYEADVGDGINDQIDVTHNLGSLAVHVTLWLNSTGREILIDVTHLDTNTIRLNFGVAPTVNQFHVFISR